MPHVKERIYPVGRLDWDTTGLLILTNDGDFTDKMIHPRNEIDKVYLARVKGIATKENLRPLTRGVVIDGKKPSQHVTILSKLTMKRIVQLLN